MSNPKSKRPLSEGIYRRVTVRMYGDERFMRLSPTQPSGQSAWLYLLTGPHTGPIPGVFVAGRAALAETLGWDAESFAKAFAECIHEGLVEFDEKTRLCFIPNAIFHNLPPNPNVVKSWRAHWLLLPECDLRSRIFDHLSVALSEVGEGFGKAFANVCGNTSAKGLAKGLPNGSRKQEQEAGGRKQELKRPTVSSAAKLPTCPTQEIIDLYHEILPDLPRARLQTKGRAKAIQKTWHWVLTSTKPDHTKRAESPDQAITWFRNYFERATANDFLMGRTPRSGEHANWKCDLDFLLTDKGMKHVIEKTETTT